MIFWPIFKKDFIAIGLEWYYFKLHEVFRFSKDSLQWLLSKEGNKTDRSKLEETENTHTPKNAKNLWGFFGFPNFLKRLYYT